MIKHIFFDGFTGFWLLKTETYLIELISLPDLNSVEHQECRFTMMALEFVCHFNPIQRCFFGRRSGGIYIHNSEEESQERADTYRQAVCMQANF